MKTFYICEVFLFESIRRQVNSSLFKSPPCTLTSTALQLQYSITGSGGTTQAEEEAHSGEGQGQGVVPWRVLVDRDSSRPTFMGMKFVKGNTFPCSVYDKNPSFFGVRKKDVHSSRSNWQGVRDVGVFPKVISVTVLCLVARHGGLGPARPGKSPGLRVPTVPSRCPIPRTVKVARKTRNK